MKNRRWTRINADVRVLTPVVEVASPCAQRTEADGLSRWNLVCFRHRTILTGRWRECDWPAEPCASNAAVACFSNFPSVTLSLRTTGSITVLLPGTGDGETKRNDRSVSH